MKKNDRVLVQITGLTGAGSGVGRVNGMAIFVAGAAVGDELIAHIIKVKKSYAVGIIHKLVTPSKNRKPVDCPVFGRCGGCTFRHLTYQAESAAKQQAVQDVMQRIGGVQKPPEPIIVAQNTVHYRNKAQYPAANGKNGVCFGFYAGHTHRVIPQSSCCLQPKIFGAALNAVKQWANSFGIKAYQEQTGSGLLRHVLLRFAEATGQLMVVPVINGTNLPFAEQLVQQLQGAVGSALQTVCYNINTEKTNVVLGPQCCTVYGSGFITDEICGVQVRISPQSFYQVNRAMATVLYQKAAGFITPADRTILDLFCGTGTVGLSVLRCTGDLTKALIGVEIVPSAVQDAEENARKAGVNARFICGDAGKAAEQLLLEGVCADVVVVDPPRKGCEPALLQTIAGGFTPKKIIYISCDPATLARDVKQLQELNYRLESYTPVDLFPGTAHVETVCLLESAKNLPHISFTVNMEDLPRPTRKSATYDEIKAYVSEKHGLKVSSLYIAQIKEKHGLKERENYNIGNGKSKELVCPPEKEQAILDAFKHFGMIK